MIIYTKKASTLSQADYTWGIARLKKKSILLYKRIRSLEFKNFTLAKQQLLNSKWN